MSVGDRFQTLAGRARAFCDRFAIARRGNVALMFALSLPLLLMVTMGGIDLHRASTVRSILQDALDAATLSAARSSYVTDAQITEVGMASLQANLAAYYPDIDISQEGAATFHLDSSGAVIAKVELRLKTIVANIVLPPYGRFMDDYLPIEASSEVLRSSKNVEVALVLDTTGSMATGTKLADLKIAAKDLIGLVVQPPAMQTPFYSRVAVVPYSMGVNLDTRAAAARGSISQGTTITNVTSWYQGSPKKVTAATRGNPVKITATGHGFANGDKVMLWSVEGMTQIANKVYTVTNRAANTFELSGVNGGNYNQFRNDAWVAECARSDCRSVVTANRHGYSNNSSLAIGDVLGLTEINDKSYQIADVTTNTFSIFLPERSAQTYSSEGKVFCNQAGCEYFRFTNVHDAEVTQRVSTCVTERTGGNAYTDVSPQVARLGRNYPSDGCKPKPLIPLTSVTATLTDQIDLMAAQGSTAGHIGIGWGWYALSPNFNGLWPSNPAGEYTDPSVLKAVVIMTDGEYNSAHYEGVISRDSTSGSGSTTFHIDNDALNGSPFSQSTALCTAMKAKGIIVYTVGFQIVDDQRARDLVSNCATNADHVYLPDSGTELKEAFRAIGREIAQLRIRR